MTIAIGDRLPSATFKTMTADGPRDLPSTEVFAGKKVVLFGVPGAFTPTCNNNHLPGYLENYDALVAKGVDTVAVVSVNDVHVMSAWARFTGGEGKLVFLADGNATFARAIGLDVDLAAGGLGTRMRRFSMIVEDGAVTAFNIEDKPGRAEKSSAAAILAAL